MNESIITLLRPTVVPYEEPINLDFVPPLQRRRLSRLQQSFFAIAHRIAGDCEHSYRMIFASQDGEDGLTRKLVATFNEDGDVSPLRFSTSVYNAAPGLYSIFTKNEAAYDAIAGQDETLDCSLLEGLIADEPNLWIYAEETNQTPTLGVMILPKRRPSDKETIQCIMRAGDSHMPHLTVQRVIAFFKGETQRLESPYFTLERL